MTAEERERLRERAERIIRKGDDSCYWNADGIIDAERVARALLGLLPAADAGEAVTAEWLVSAGFAMDKRHREPGLSVSIRPIGRLFWRPDSPTWAFIVTRGDDAVRVPFATRGDVARLCAALGIPLAPAAGGGA